MINITNFINGQFIDSNNKKKLDVISPHNEQVIATLCISNKEDVDVCVTHANNAFKLWSKIDVKKRIKYLIKLNQILNDHKEELANLIVLEHGKNKAEALGEVQKGIEQLEYSISMPTILRGRILQVATNVKCQVENIPIGVITSIVPFNFPFMVPMWTIPIAIATGNCIIVKPSEKVPLTMNKFAEFIKLSGLPDGVFQIINGTANTVTCLCNHIGIKGVTFVGSTNVARIVHKLCSEQSIPKRVSCMGGAKNYLVAMPDCNIDKTVNDIITSFSGCSGQRCMAASVLLIVGNQNTLLQKLIKLVSFLEKGNEKNQIGPIIDKASIQKIVNYINFSEKTGSEILVDGRKWMKDKPGYWIGPTIILHNNNTNDPALNNEIFGPVLSILQVNTKEEAIEIENNNPYGNAACIYTSKGGNAEWFQKRFSAGMIGVNIGVPVPQTPFSFGGINASRYSTHDITGEGCINFMINKKKTTTRW